MTKQNHADDKLILVSSIRAIIINFVGLIKRGKAHNLTACFPSGKPFMQYFTLTTHK